MQPGYSGVSREGLRVANVCEDYPKTQVIRENLVDIQRAIGRLEDELAEEGFILGLVDSYWSRGAVILVCQDEVTKDWLAAKTHIMEA